MKTIFFKKLMPLAVFALGIGGAFTTMSMQETAKSNEVKGYAINSQTQQPCSLEINCVDFGTEMCRVSYPSGHIAYDKPGGICLDALWRP